jgi:hypothetical protein
VSANAGPEQGRKYAPPADCWIHEAVEVRLSAIEGRGLFAKQDLPAGSVVARLGGRLVSDAELERLIADRERDPECPYIDSIAVHEGRNLLIPPGQPIHFANHSCDPNPLHVGPYTLAARRDVAAGEELTIDYATHTTNPRMRFDCDCGSSQCRGTVTGEDWRNERLQERYGQHWVPAVLHKIADSTGTTLSARTARGDNEAVALHSVEELAGTVASVLEGLRGDLGRFVPGIEVEHIGATALPDGLTKGDVDVNLRVSPEQFDRAVAELSGRFDIAQPQNWTAAYASFSDDRRALPVGIQVTVKGSDADFLVTLRDRLAGDARLRQDYTGSAARARCPAMEAATADSAVENSACSPSPVPLITWPP